MRASDIAYATLLEEIQSGTLAPGSVLAEVEQAAALLASFGFGVLGTQRLLAAHLGGGDLMADPAATAYQRLSMAIFTDGLFTTQIPVGDDPRRETEKET